GFKPKPLSLRCLCGRGDWFCFIEGTGRLSSLGKRKSETNCEVDSENVCLSRDAIAARHARNQRFTGRRVALDLCGVASPTLKPLKIRALLSKFRPICPIKT